MFTVKVNGVFHHGDAEMIADTPHTADMLLSDGRLVTVVKMARFYNGLMNCVIVSPDMIGVQTMDDTAQMDAEDHWDMICRI